MTGFHPTIHITVKSFLFHHVRPAERLSIVHSMCLCDLLTSIVHGSLLLEEVVDSKVSAALDDNLTQFKAKLILASQDDNVTSALLTDFEKLSEVTDSIMNLFIRHKVYFHSADFDLILTGNAVVEWIAKCVRLCEDHLRSMSGASALKKQFKELFKTAVPIMRRWGVDFDESLLHRVIRSLYMKRS
jgi:hypothetical protein